MRLKARAAGLSLALWVAAGSPADAKVVFTGYGNMQMTAHQHAKIYGDAPALAAFRISPVSVKGRGFNVESVGIFATTSLKENLDFLVDFTYRQIGNTTGETRIQYAYLEHSPWEDFRYRLGKITLPFGYYNQKRFYAFQRVELTAPIFQSAILGLPISNPGASAQKRLTTGAGRLDFDVYAVNGYGAVPTSPNVFRSATLPGALVLSNNLGASNNNGNIAFGGRARLAEIAGRDMEAGASYYGGAWDSGGSKYFQMANGHFHSNLSRLDFLVEYFHLDVVGDSGFAAAVSDDRWMSDGYFMTASYPLWTIREMPLTPFVSTEYTLSRGHNGTGGQERLHGYRAGLTLLPMDAIRIKTEYGYFWYNLPLAGKGDLKLDFHTVLLSLVVTF